GSSLSFLEEDLAQVETEMRLEQPAAEIDVGAERGLRLVEAMPHARVLRPLAREEEGDRPVAGLRSGGEQALGVERLQGHRGVVEVARQQRPAVLERLASMGEGEGDVGKIKAWAVPQVVRQARRRPLQRVGALRREENELLRARAARRS